MNYDQALDYLNGLTKFGIKFGLERITALSHAFGNPHRRLRVIHVGGTNGKGSTCTFISSILREAGYRIGIYLSPYVHDVRERIQINGRYISKEDFAEIISEIQPIADDISESSLGPVTEFELKTMAAFLYFAREQVDFAVMEVGMGGRYDATNIVDPLVAVITNVSLDHMDRLGNTVEEIAAEKSMIIKTGTVLVTAADNEAAWNVILDHSRREGAETWRVMKSHVHKKNSPSADVQMRYTSRGNRFSIHGGEVSIKDLKPGLAGNFQHTNAATAVTAITAMRKYEVRIPEQAIRAGIANAYIPGRMEILQDRPKLIIDGAHNPDAAKNLAASIKDNLKYERMILVVGMLSTHPAGDFLAHIGSMASKIIATKSNWHLAAPAETIAGEAKKICEDVEVVPNVQDAVKRALEVANENDLVVVTGSFYTIGEVEESKL